MPFMLLSISALCSLIGLGLFFLFWAVRKDRRCECGGGDEAKNGDRGGDMVGNNWKKWKGEEKGRRRPVRELVEEARLTICNAGENKMAYYRGLHSCIEVRTMTGVGNESFVMEKDSVSVAFFFRLLLFWSAVAKMRVQTCLSQGAVKEAMEVLKLMESQMPFVRRTTYVVVARRLTQMREIDLLERMLGRMWLQADSRSAPDERMCALAANAAFEARRVDSALRIVERMRKAGVEPALLTYSILIKGSSFFPSSPSRKKKPRRPKKGMNEPFHCFPSTKETKKSLLICFFP